MRCAFCHGSDPNRPCYGCGTSLHSDCWALAGECPTLGCEALRTPPAPLATSILGALLLALTFWIGDVTLPRYYGCCCFFSVPEYRTPHPFGKPRRLEPLRPQERSDLLPWEYEPSPEPADLPSFLAATERDEWDTGPWSSIHIGVGDRPRREENGIPEQPQP